MIPLWLFATIAMWGVGWGRRGGKGGASSLLLFTAEFLVVNRRGGGVVVLTCVAWCICSTVP